MIEAVKKFLRREGFFISLITILVAASFAPLFLGYAFFSEEQIGFYYPHSFFYARALSEGTSLLWNNGYYAGISVPFDQFISSYFPLNRFLFSFFPFMTAHHLSIFLGVWLGSLFAYFFGRSFGFSRNASFVLFSSYLLATTFGWLSIGTLAAWSFFMTPALFWAILQVSKPSNTTLATSIDVPTEIGTAKVDILGKGSRTLLWTILGGVFIGIGFLAGFAQITFYGYVMAGVFAFYLYFSGGLKRSMLAAFGGMTILGVIISLPQTLPSLFLVGSSVRTTGFALQNVNSPGIIQFIAFLFPEYVKTPFTGGGGTHGFYVGALAFLAACSGFLIRRTKVQTFFFLLYAGILLIAFRIFPFFWLNDFIPPFSRFSSSFRWTVAASFPLAFLAAFGYQGLVSIGVSPEKEKRFFRLIFWGIIALFLIIVAANISLLIFEKMPGLQNYFLDWYFKGKSISFPREHYASVLQLYINETQSSISILDWKLAGSLFFLLISFFLIKYFREGLIGKEKFKRLSLLLISANVLLVPSALFGRAFFQASILVEKPRIIQAIEKQENNFEDFRIASFLIGDSVFWDITSKRKLTPEEHAKILRETLVLNTNLFYGIDRLDGAEYYRTLRHNNIINTVIFPKWPYVFDREAFSSFAGPLDKLYNTGILKTVTLEERVKDLYTRLPLLSAFNVKYIYSLIALSDKSLQEVPLPPAFVGRSGFGGRRPADSEGIPIRLYENKNVIPRIYFPEQADLFTGDEKELLGKVADNKDFRKTAFIECGLCPSTGDGAATSTIFLYQDGILEAGIDVEEGRWLIFSESFSPGWEARVDEGEVPIYRANYIMQGIYIPSGPHLVEFRHIGVIAQKWKEYQKKFRD